MNQAHSTARLPQTVHRENNGLEQAGRAVNGFIGIQLSKWCLFNIWSQCVVNY